MLTRCPTCSTTFRVTPDQLKARQGRVRCGACQNIFNALDALVETPVVPTTPHQEPVAVESVRAPAEEPTPPPVEEPALPPVEEPLPAAEELPPPAAEKLPPPAAEPPPTADEPPVPPAAEAEPEAPLMVPELELPPAEGIPRRWPWALGIVAGLVILGLQATIHFRTAIAVLYPDAKPWLVVLCDGLGCKVALPHRPDLVGIETSDLAPNGDGRLLLAATLRNRAPFAQEFPHLELTLTDTADRALVRRVVPPADYLPPQAELAAGFGAGAELAVNLVIDAPGVAAAGYRLYLFYP